MKGSGPKLGTGKIWYHDNVKIPGAGPAVETVELRTHSPNPGAPLGKYSRSNYTTQISVDPKRYRLSDGTFKLFNEDDRRGTRSRAYSRGQLVMKIDSRFDRGAFEASTEQVRDALARDLSDVLREGLPSSGEAEFHSAIYGLIEQLRALGHDLYSFDESDEMQAWCPDWSTPGSSGLDITFQYPKEVSTQWRERD